MCPRRVRKRQGELGLQESRPARAGAASAPGNKRGGRQRGTNVETEQGKTKIQEKSQQRRNWERREPHRSGEGHREGQSRRAPMGRGRGRGGKERETKNKRRETKRQWESIPPHPSLPEL